MCLCMWMCICLHLCLCLCLCPCLCLCLCLCLCAFVCPCLSVCVHVCLCVCVCVASVCDHLCPCLPCVCDRMCACMNMLMLACVKMHTHLIFTPRRLRQAGLQRQVQDGSDRQDCKDMIPWLDKQTQPRQAWRSGAAETSSRLSHLHVHLELHGKPACSFMRT